MAEEKGTSRARGGGRRPAARASDDADAPRTEPEASATTPEPDAPAEDAADAPRPDAEEVAEAPSEGGAAVPPPPPPAPTAPEDDGEEAAYPKTMLISRAETLLDADMAVARGVLKEAPDLITISAAKDRIQQFLGGDVVDNDQEATTGD